LYNNSVRLWLIQRLTYPMQTWPAILANRNSVFDSRSWLAQRSLGVASTNAAVGSLKTTSIIAMQQFCTLSIIRIPQLVRLVRAACEAPQDALARAKATALAHALYTPNLDAWIEENLKLGIIKEASPLQTTYPLPTVYHFQSYLVYTTCMAYFNLRLILCGLVLTLSAIEPRFEDTRYPQFAIAQVSNEDIRAACWIAMTVEYVEQCGKSMPVSFDLVRHYEPLALSFGAWHRLEQQYSRQPLGGAKEINEHARLMKVWVRDTLNRFAQQWNYPQVQEDALVCKQTTYAGGSLGNM
jgi:hypothetical protein